MTPNIKAIEAEPVNNPEEPERRTAMSDDRHPKFNFDKENFDPFAYDRSRKLSIQPVFPGTEGMRL